jgi:hypothetical protein
MSSNDTAALKHKRRAREPRSEEEKDTLVRKKSTAHRASRAG